jgi:signal peptidase I
MFWKKKEKPQGKKKFSEGIGSFALAIGIALTIRWALMEAYVIPSGSMLPSLLIRDHIFVNKIVYGMRVPFAKTWLVKFNPVKRGEVIVFRYPENESVFFIKRVVGLPGDELAYEDGTLYVNGKKIERQTPDSQDDLNWVRDFEIPGGKSNYIYYQEEVGDHKFRAFLRKGGLHTEFGPLKVPQGSLFVMGDNRDNSNDSRFWGVVPIENILGRAMFVWLSCEETLPVVSFLCNPLEVRWKRFFHSIH